MTPLSQDPSRPGLHFTVPSGHLNDPSGWALYVTGGLSGPVVFVIVLHVLAVSLLGSFRSGLKLALWHSLVVMCVLEAVSTGLLPARSGVEGSTS